MKYEITQQQYVDFLNKLTQTQATARKFDQPTPNYRYAITGSSIGSYATTNPYVACNYLSWADLAAYFDWSGLRPMTELEFEKACRGTRTATANEYAWGTTSIAGSVYTLNNSGASNEVIATNYSTSVGNALYLTTGSTIIGPGRVGIFAGTSGNNGRVTAGATYYGIMEMSGNLWERPVTVSNSAGRAFTGINGDGKLDDNGNADGTTVGNWPAGTDAAGAGFRGGTWGSAAPYLRVSDRYYAAHADGSRYADCGGRGVRVAP